MRRIDAYFSETGLHPRGDRRMHIKTALFFTWTIASYGLLVFAVEHVALALACGVSLGLAAAGIGFSVMHDGNHSAYSRSRRLNVFMGASLDVLGGSSYVWRWKHNTFHHQFTNIQGLDDDIDLGVLCRMGPDQPWHRFHRYQHLYVWVLYCFMVVKWHAYDDFANLLTRRIGDQAFPRPRGQDLAILIGGKVAFFGLAFGIPLLFHAWWVVLLFYLFITVVMSLTLSLVFQMAHCTDEAAFTPASREPRRLEEEWAVHQVETTVNFAPKSRWLTWYAGSLNYQIEHHLFPRICHIHFPALSEIIKDVCREYDVRYVVHQTLREAVTAHYAWLFLLGRPTTAQV